MATKLHNVGLPRSLEDIQASMEAIANPEMFELLRDDPGYCNYYPLNKLGHNNAPEVQAVADSISTVLRDNQDYLMSRGVDTCCVVGSVASGLGDVFEFKAKETETGNADIRKFVRNESPGAGSDVDINVHFNDPKTGIEAISEVLSENLESVRTCIGRISFYGYKYSYLENITTALEAFKVGSSIIPTFCFLSRHDVDIFSSRYGWREEIGERLTAVVMSSSQVRRYCMENTAIRWGNVQAKHLVKRGLCSEIELAGQRISQRSLIELHPGTTVTYIAPEAIDELVIKKVA